MTVKKRSVKSTSFLSSMNSFCANNLWVYNRILNITTPHKDQSYLFKLFFLFGLRFTGQVIELGYGLVLDTFKLLYKPMDPCTGHHMHFVCCASQLSLNLNFGLCLYEPTRAANKLSISCLDPCTSYHSYLLSFC